MASTRLTAGFPAPLAAFLAERLRISNKKAKALLDERRVFVNGRRIWMARHGLKPGDRVEIQEETEKPPELSRTALLFESPDYLIANKPPGMLSNGPASMEHKLRMLPGNAALRAVHRLDRDTSGCLLFARNDSAEAKIKPLFREHRIRKIYHAIACGQVRGFNLEITQPIENRSALTRIRVLRSNKSASHLRVEIPTGRTHQIRKHLVAIGHPLAGDRHYATRRTLCPLELTVRRQMLHAMELSFPHPATGRMIQGWAPLPEDFKKCLRLFGLA